MGVSDRIGIAAPVTVRTFGKSSIPDWKRVTTLLRKTTRRAVDLRLRGVEGGPDISDLVQSLLADWLTTSDVGSDIA